MPAGTIHCKPTTMPQNQRRTPPSTVPSICPTHRCQLCQPNDCLTSTQWRVHFGISPSIVAQTRAFILPEPSIHHQHLSGDIHWRQPETAADRPYFQLAASNTGLGRTSRCPISIGKDRRSQFSWNRPMAFALIPSGSASAMARQLTASAAPGNTVGARWVCREAKRQCDPTPRFIRHRV